MNLSITLLSKSGNVPVSVEIDKNGARGEAELAGKKYLIRGASYIHHKENCPVIPLRDPKSVSGGGVAKISQQDHEALSAAVAQIKEAEKAAEAERLAAVRKNLMSLDPSTPVTLHRGFGSFGAYYRVKGIGDDEARMLGEAFKGSLLGKKLELDWKHPGGELYEGEDTATAVLGDLLALCGAVQQEKEAQDKERAEKEAAALAEARRTGQPAFLFSYSGGIDDEEGCYYGVDVFVRPDGTRFEKKNLSY